MSTSVVIIGAGPTGLMLALELSLLNVPFRIIDALPRPKSQSRALTIHPRTLELLVRHGLSERIATLGLPMETMRLFVSQRLCSEASLPGGHIADTSFPHALVLDQRITEELFTKRLAEYDSNIEWGMCAQKIETDDDGNGVSVWLKDADEVETVIKCQYVVGCDGAHSMVRKSAGIKFEGEMYPQNFIVADLKLEWEQKICPHMFLGKESGWLGIFPMSGKDDYRVVCLRNFTPCPTQPLPEPQLSELEEVIATLVPGKVRLHDLTWLSGFRIHHRIASTYRAGRLFVAGDAAHIHAPFGGQGMNAGIQDAANLAWKLARVLHSSAPASLLDSYDAERRKVGQALLQITDRAATTFLAANPLKIWMRNTACTWVLPWVRGLEKNGRKFSQLNIRYRDSQIVGTATGWTGKLKGGDRALDGQVENMKGQRMKFQELFKRSSDHLVLFTGSNSSNAYTIYDSVRELKTWIGPDVILHILFRQKLVDKLSSECYIDPEGKVHDLYDFKEPGYVLVRPDGYISFIGDLASLDEMKNWLTSQKGVREHE